jgi:pilus assembly protein CpaD
LAAAVANPEDLIQPRSETAAYAARRRTVMEKYRKGEDPSTIYSKTNDAKTSNVGQ